MPRDESSTVQASRIEYPHTHRASQQEYFVQAGLDALLSCRTRLLLGRFATVLLVYQPAGEERKKTYPIVTHGPELTHPFEVREIGFLFGFCSLLATWIPRWGDGSVHIDVRSDEHAEPGVRSDNGGAGGFDG